MKIEARHERAFRMLKNNYNCGSLQLAKPIHKSYRFSIHVAKRSFSFECEFNLLGHKFVSLENKLF